MKCKILCKRLKDFDMARGCGTLFYTFLLWINTKGAPVPIRDKLMKCIKFRIGFDVEESFTEENSLIRENNGLITVTFRGSKELNMIGDMTWMPFGLLYLEFNYEISHFEIDIDNKHYLVRYNFMQH